MHACFRRAVGAASRTTRARRFFCIVPLWFVPDPSLPGVQCIMQCPARQISLSHCVGGLSQTGKGDRWHGGFALWLVQNHKAAKTVVDWSGLVRLAATVGSSFQYSALVAVPAQCKKLLGGPMVGLKHSSRERVAQLLQILQLCDVTCEWVHESAPHTYVTAEQVKVVKSALPGLVLAPLDRNPGMLHAQCGRLWHAEYHALFVTDPHYVAVHAPVQQVMADLRWDFEHHARNLCRIAPWDPGGTFGTAYMLKKFKDPVRKARPICPCDRHPCRRMLNAVGRCLGLVLTRICDWDHFDISSTDALARHLEGLDVDSVRHLLASYDVDNMFTELSHDAIDDDIHALLLLAAPVFRSKRFYVYKREKRGAYVGKPPERRMVRTVQWDQLHAAVMFEVQHAYFFAGGVLLQQRNGIAQGGLLSPFVARLVCIMRELRLMSLYRRCLRTFVGCRYVDDSLVLVDRRDRPFLNTYQTQCYHSGMVLKCDDPPGLYMRILEAEMLLHERGIHVVQYNKNTECMLTLGVQQYLRFYHSTNRAVVPRTRSAVLVGMLTRFVRNTGIHSYALLWRPIWVLLFECRALGYSWRRIYIVLRGMSLAKFPLYQATRAQFEILWAHLLSCVEQFMRTDRMGAAASRCSLPE
jgi:hypothetical protein